MLARALLDHEVTHVDDIRLHLNPGFQHIAQRQIDQVRCLHVDTEQVLEQPALPLAVAIRRPVAGIVHDGPQCRSQLTNRRDEGLDTCLAGEIRLHGANAQRAQGIELFPLASITDDDRMTIIDQSLGTIAPQTLGAARDQYRGLTHSLDSFRQCQAASSNVRLLQAETSAGSSSGSRGA